MKMKIEKEVRVRKYREQELARGRAVRKLRRENGLCADCGQQVFSGKYRCEPCRIATRDCKRRRRWIYELKVKLEGKCYYCQAPATKRRCDKCRIKDNKQSFERYHSRKKSSHCTDCGVIVIDTMRCRKCLIANAREKRMRGKNEK